MPADDALLVIDANRYLAIYSAARGKELLAPIAEQAQHIFVTRQIVDEFQRNKLDVAAAFLSNQAATFGLKGYAVPDHLFGADPKQSEALRKEMAEISDREKSLKKQVTALGRSILEQIFRSQDEVSRSLAEVFASAVQETRHELSRARHRRERGNPPGKQGDPLGDQLTWEQILSRFNGKKRLWLITSDRDYATSFGGRWFLNPFLFGELCKINAAAEAFVFDDVVARIRDFAKATGTRAEKLPSAKAAAEIKAEERSFLSQVEEDEGRWYLNSLNVAIGSARNYFLHSFNQLQPSGEDEFSPQLYKPGPVTITHRPAPPQAPPPASASASDSGDG